PGERAFLTYIQPRIGDPQNPLNQQAAFLRAVMNGEPPPVDGRAGLRDIAVVEAIYRSASCGRFVDVEAP
ncbi:MAG: Gfo/Idh/MocA family oxidoreductase, partial [Anaerolineae bacterium]